MKTLELEKFDVLELREDEMAQIEGGMILIFLLGMAIGAGIYLLTHQD